MRHRFEWEIVYDILNPLKDRQLPTPVKIALQWGKVAQYSEEKYIDILEGSKFVEVTGNMAKPKWELTERGIQFLIFFEAIEKLMRGLIAP